MTNRIELAAAAVAALFAAGCLQLDPARSELTVSKHAARADGIDAISVTIAIKGTTLGWPLTGRAVLIWTGSASTVSTPATTNARGETTAVWTSLQPEAATIHAAADGEQLDATATATFTLTGPSPTRSTLVVSTPPPVVADGSSGYSIQLQIIDDLRNPLEGLTVDDNDSVGSGLVTSSGTTDSSGNVDLTLGSTVAGDATLKVAVDRAGWNAVLATQPVLHFDP